MKKIIKGDLVVVLSGKDKGKQGRVLSVLGDKVTVGGVNVVRRHQKPSQVRGIEGGIVEKNMPIYVSKVAFLNPETRKVERIGIKVVEKNGKLTRVRVLKSTGVEV